MQRFSIREGWSTFFLTAAIVFISVWSIQRADWADGLGILNVITLAGLLAGLFVSKQRQMPTPVAHLVAFLGGAIIVFFQMTEYLDDRLGGRGEKLSWLLDRGERWVELIANGESTDDLYLFVLFISGVTFLLAYSTVWFVMRARWIWAALVFPALLLFINLGYSLRVPTGLVVLYLFFSLLLLVRFTLLERETTWRRLRIDYPSSLAWRGMWAATYLAVFILTFGWVFPASAQSGRAYDAWLSVDGPWRSVESQFNEWFAGLRGPGRSGVGGFASFSDSFDLGGPLRLSDTPVVLVTGASESPYLSAHRYSVYTGRGWESEFTQDEDAEGQQEQLPPQVELQPGEQVDIGQSTIDTREVNEYTIEVQRPRGGLVYSPEVFLYSDVGVNLVVPWQTREGQIDLVAETPEDYPRELSRLVELSLSGDFGGQPVEDGTEPAVNGTVTVTPESAAIEVTPTPSPTPEPAREPAEVTRERESLAQRGITTDYTIDTSVRPYAVTSITYSGQFPIFSEVEAVYARDGLEPGQTYQVTGLETTAESADLRTAMLDSLPSEITSRYLQLPGTVTPRTVELAQAVTANAQNPYDKSKAIETYLRQTIAYTEDIEFPPEDRDVVDYVLFDSLKGYCEYYASAFIVMARSQGIPARMVTGFFPAERDADAGGFLYRERNAHAWPEVYLDGFGWVQFEPTAARSEISREPAAPVDAGVGNTSSDPAIGSGLELPFDEELLNTERALRESGGAGTAVVDQDEPVSRTEWALRAAFLVLMIVTLALVYLWLRGMRGLTPASQLYAKAVRGATWGGVRPEAAMTPHEYARAMAREVPGSRAPATYLADLYVRETYGQRPIAQSEMLRARQAWMRLRGLLMKHFFSRLRPWRPSRVEEDDASW